MTLKQWLDGRNMEPRDFASLIGRSPEAVRRYVAGERIPDRGTMPLIVDQTSGEVTPNDFFDLPSPSEGTARKRADRTEAEAA